MRKITIHYPDNVEINSITLGIVVKGNSHEDRTITDLREGEIAYTLPWALAGSRFGYLRVNRDYPADPTPHGTASMKIRKGRGIVFVESDTVVEDSIANWPSDRCFPVMLMSSVEESLKIIRINLG